MPLPALLSAALKYGTPFAIKGLESLFRGKTREDSPRYDPLEFKSELPANLQNLLSTISSGERATLGNQFTSIARGAGEQLSATGRAGTGARQALTRELTSQRGEVLQGLLSSQANRVLATLGVFNQFRAGQQKLKFGADVARVSSRNQFMSDTIGGLGAGAALGYT